MYDDIKTLAGKRGFKHFSISVQADKEFVVASIVGGEVKAESGKTLDSALSLLFGGRSLEDEMLELEKLLNG